MEVLFVDNLTKRAYINDVTDVYNKYLLIDINYLRSIENELISKEEYLPVLVRRYLSIDYFNYIKTKNNASLLEKLNDTRRLTNKDAVEDLQVWLKKHPQYKDLFIINNYNRLNNELKTLEKQYKDLKLW